MLKKLLTPEDCAKCRLCCSFDSYDLWETPIITRDMASKIMQEYSPKQEFVRRDDFFLLKMDKEPNADLYYCPMLDPEKGCTLGSDKPFDCRIWPFRIMVLNAVRVITLSPVCPVVNKKPISEIIEVAANVSKEIFDEADAHPEIVKPYIKGYPILVVEDSKYSSNLIK